MASPCGSWLSGWRLQGWLEWLEWLEWPVAALGQAGEARQWARRGSGPGRQGVARSWLAGQLDEGEAGGLLVTYLCLAVAESCRGWLEWLAAAVVPAG